MDTIVMDQAEDTRKAPLALMSEFLVCVNETRMVDALQLSAEILDIEPENQLIKEYQKTLRRYIRQEREEQEDKKGEATESEADSDSEEDEESSAESKSSDDSSDDGGGGYEEKKSERNLSSEASRFRK